MTVIALAIWFSLYALTTLCHAAIPEWVLGISALVVVIVLFLGGAWRAKGNSALTLILACSLLLLAGCSTFHVTQTDESPNERKITSDIKATAWFSSAQNVAKLKAIQTDKTQSFGADGASQHGATNIVAGLEALARIAEALNPK